MILLIASFAALFLTPFGGTIIKSQTQLLPQNASSNIAHLSANTTPNFISVIKGGGPTINSDRMRTKSIMNITRMKADGPPPRVHPLQALAKGSATGISMPRLPSSKLGRGRAVSSGFVGIRKAAGTFKTNAINGNANIFPSDGDDDDDREEHDPGMADKERRLAELIRHFSAKILSRFHLQNVSDKHRQDRANIDYVAKLLMLTGEKKTQNMFLGQASQLVVILHVLENNILRQSYMVCVVEDLLERNPGISADFLQRYFKFRQLEELILGLLTDVFNIEGSRNLDGANSLIAFLEIKKGQKLGSLKAKIKRGKDVLRKARSIQFECNNFIGWTIVSEKQVPIVGLPPETVERCTEEEPKPRGYWNRR